MRSLMSELTDIRKHLKIAHGRKERCVAAIKKAKPDAEIPLEPFEVELEELRVELAETKKELEIERRISSELRSSLDSIRQESKEPFVVPGLLDAFLSISNLAARVR